MGKLSTHVLDTLHGRPAHGMAIDLYRLRNGERTRLKHVRTNADGRCDAPLLEGADFTEGVYELTFHAGDYFADQGVDTPSPRFTDQVTVRFGVANASENYHVPLLVTPWAWSTYRGS